MALNASYQLTDGGGKTKKTTSNNKGTKVASGAKSVAQLGSVVKNAVNNAGRNGGTPAPAAGYKPRNTATQTAGSTTHKTSSGSTGGSSSGSSGGSSGGSSPAPAATTTASTVPEFKAKEWVEPVYQQSQAVTDAFNKLQALQAPVYNNPFEATLNSLYEKILNRPKFTYNVNADRLYQMYKDQYMQSGQTAMKDTMAQASALTGGYGNSYAQTAGQQQYQNYLQDLNNMVPTLANQAYGRYQDEGNNMRGNYSMIEGRYEDVYNKFRDAMSDYDKEKAYLTDRYEQEKTDDWNKFVTNRNAARSQYESDRDYDFKYYQYLKALEEKEKENANANA